MITIILTAPHASTYTQPYSKMVNFNINITNAILLFQSAWFIPVFTDVQVNVQIHRFIETEQ